MTIIYHCRKGESTQWSNTDEVVKKMQDENNMNCQWSVVSGQWSVVSGQ